MFWKKAKKRQLNPEIERAVIRCSICTGEQAAGFKNLETGKFEEIMLIKSDSDLEQFKKIYGVKDIVKEY